MFVKNANTFVVITLTHSTVINVADAVTIKVVLFIVMVAARASLIILKAATNAGKILAMMYAVSAWKVSLKEAARLCYAATKFTGNVLVHT